MKVSENNENKIIPYIKATPKEIAENEIVQSENNAVLKLKTNQEELTAVYIFDENKNLVKTVSNEQYRETGGISLQDLEGKNYTFEVATPFYNLQFRKAISGQITESNTDIFTQNRQIKVKANSDIRNISIYSISGALVVQQEINKPVFESSSLESGVYVVQLTLTNGKIIHKK